MKFPLCAFASATLLMTAGCGQSDQGGEPAPPQQSAPAAQEAETTVQIRLLDENGNVQIDAAIPE